jgi:hypothetical protein
MLVGRPRWYQIFKKRPLRLVGTLRWQKYHYSARDNALALNSHSQCTGGEDIINCAICQRDISNNNSPAYFCSQCEQTVHVSCEKGKILHKTEKSEGPLDDDCVCSSCTQLNQTIPYGNDHSIAESIL